MKEVYLLFREDLSESAQVYGVLETRGEANRHKTYLEYKYNSKFRIEKFNVGLPNTTLEFEKIHGVIND